MNRPLRILYVGSLRAGGTCGQRRGALEDLGHQMTGVDTEPDGVSRRQKTFLGRVIRKLAGPQDWAGANQAILQAFQRQSFDILWIDKGLTVQSNSLRRAHALQPECVIVGYSPDDMYARHNQSRAFLGCLPFYDIFFTTKTYNVPELKMLGCPRVEFVGNAYDPRTHRPINLSEEDRRRLGGAVGFIGQWEPERAASICLLASRGIDVRVWGYTWERCRFRSPHLKLENRPVWGDDYARTVCAFDINLCFLRKMNRDLQTTRSIEIPACGAFMLAERTEEHQAMFEEGKEAEFFDCDQELLEKVRYYMDHPRQRQEIAGAGRRRCLASGYSNLNRMRNMLEIVGRLSDNGR